MGTEAVQSVETWKDREMYRLETEQRIRNLAWTVSGDYSWEAEPAFDLYQRSKARGMYAAICESAFFRCFKREELSLYLLKKMYYQADAHALARISRICMDAASWEWIVRDRKGIPDIRRKAADDFLEQELVRCSMSSLGRLEMMYYTRILGNTITAEPIIEGILAELNHLSACVVKDEGDNSAYPVIVLVDRIYNQLVDTNFEKKHGGLEQVLDVTLEELAEADFNWNDFLREDAVNERDVQGTEEEAASTEGSQRHVRNTQAVELDEEDRKKTYAYMELNYGRSYMKELEQKRMNYQICRGIHEDCKLYFTEGILHNMVRRNYQSESVRQQHRYNLTAYGRSKLVAEKHIQILSDTLKQALIRRTEIDRVRSDTGAIQVRELWKAGRTGDNRLFQKDIRQQGIDFVVDILMDASGSQRDRRGQVAVQGYMISEALSNVGIPHRVQSFCTCWDYTILQRFRDYDDSREKNKNIFEFSTSANNRDGLAIRGTVYKLMQRQEENRILIILSDGRPNDRVVNRSISRAPALYVGDVAVHDTAAEVRWARNHGIAVLGVFAGEEQDLDAEKRIFGRDFAYIRQITNFSQVVGRYLRRQLDAGES